MLMRYTRIDAREFPSMCTRPLAASSIKGSTPVKELGLSPVGPPCDPVYPVVKPFEGLKTSVYLSPSRRLTAIHLQDKVQDQG